MANLLEEIKEIIQLEIKSLRYCIEEQFKIQKEELTNIFEENLLDLRDEIEIIKSKNNCLVNGSDDSTDRDTSLDSIHRDARTLVFKNIPEERNEKNPHATKALLAETISSSLKWDHAGVVNNIIMARRSSRRPIGNQQIRPIIATFTREYIVEKIKNKFSQMMPKSKNGTVIKTKNLKDRRDVIKGKRPENVNNEKMDVVVYDQDRQVVARIQEIQCQHNTVIKDMCCDCRADLRKEPGIPGELTEPVIASVPVVHNILELKVSLEEAQRLARYDEEQLLKARKLVLVVDLDMTLIHTTVAPVPKDAKDVFSFTLPGHQYEYHTKLRPNARKFLESISKFFELHIFTMGSRMYAHTVAKCLDPDGKFFAHRIRSRDEFINSFSKFHDLKALFPCGDHMVCIIDDREDVWSYAPNLILVKPYQVFKGADDINDPFKPELTLLNDGKPASATEGNPIDVNGFEINGKVTPTMEIEEASDEKNGKAEVGESKEGESKEGERGEDVASVNAEGSAVSDESNESSKVDASSANSDGSPPAAVEAQDTPAVVSRFAGDVRTDLDDYLFYLDEILERIHYNFYSTLDAVKAKGGAARKDPEITKFCSFNTLNPDVRVIVPEIRRLTLKGSNIVFTGVVPTNIPLEKSKPWRTAISLGARVTQDIIPKTQPNEVGLYTTHVVAARHGTKKAFRASRSPDINLVNPNWLWCAGERWEWPEEGIFPVPLSDEKNEKKSPVNSRQGTPLHNAFEQNNKNKKISPLAAKDFDLPGGYDPEHFLKDGVMPFSKQELDAMDKEVEELMQSGSDDEAGDNTGDNVKATNKKTNVNENTDTPDVKRKRKNSPTEPKNSSDKKLKKSASVDSEIGDQDQDQDQENSSDSSSSSSNDSSGDDEDDDDNNDDNSSDSDSSSSDESDSSSEDEEDQMGKEIERRISESSS